MTTILFDATKVKSPRSGHRFGSGILATRPVYQAPCSQSDAAWWAEQCAASEDRHFDRLAAESANLDRLELGLCC